MRPRMRVFHWEMKESGWSASANLKVFFFPEVNSYEYFAGSRCDAAGNAATASVLCAHESYDRTPTIFDPGKYGAFLLDAPPAPWLDLGWVNIFNVFALR